MVDITAKTATKVIGETFSMVIVQLIGGLGNQLFQYAAGRALAEHNQTELKVDISAFDLYKLRTYKLNHFNVTAEFATSQEIRRLLPRRRDLAKRLHHSLLRLVRPPHRCPVFNETSLTTLQSDFFKIRQDVYLIGYWQSERYFADIADIIRREFSFRQKPDRLNQDVLDSINQKNSVSVHIRRGDYVTNPEVNRVHGTLGNDYYHTAVKSIAEGISNPHFFVFSDDIPWVKENLRIEFPITYVDQNGSIKDYEDLRLMSHCKYHIIANSSFSWWGAWLCNHSDKHVVAPKQWFAQVPGQKLEIFPEGWQLL